MTTPKSWSQIVVEHHEPWTTKHMRGWRIVVTTPSGARLDALIQKPADEELSEFQARTIWKNERRLFRRLADVK